MAKNVKPNMEREEPNSAMSKHALKILMDLLVVLRIQQNAWHAREVSQSENSVSTSLKQMDVRTLLLQPTLKNAARLSLQAV